MPLLEPSHDSTELVEVCQLDSPSAGWHLVGFLSNRQFEVQAIRWTKINLGSRYMRQSTVEKRLSDLETRVSELDRVVKQPSRPKDWRRSIGVFTDDPAMQAVLNDALRIRAANRATARRRAARKPSRA
jgi:hypothetical protein